MADTDIKGDRKSAPLLVFSKAFYTCWQAANQIKETAQDWESCTRRVSHNTHLEVEWQKGSHLRPENNWQESCRKEGFQADAQFHWHSLRKYFHEKSAPVSSRFEIKVSSGRTRCRHDNAGLKLAPLILCREVKNVCPWEFVSSCLLRTSGLPAEPVNLLSRTRWPTWDGESGFAGHSQTPHPAVNPVPSGPTSQGLFSTLPS